jgi:hypothetical protein
MVLTYSHAAKLESIESFSLVWDSFKGEHLLGLSIIASLVGCVDVIRAAGPTPASPTLVLS